MAVQFKVPASPKRSVETISEFLGVDFTNAPANIDPRRSPNCQNMVRDVPGKVRKTLGYAKQNEYTGEKINGFHDPLIHAGTKLYAGDTAVYTGMNDSLSHSWNIDDKTYIIDGHTLFKYYQTESGGVVTHHIAPASSGAYIPTVTIAKAPNGGGTPYEDLNLLQPGFTEQFLGVASERVYQLSFNGLDATTVTAQVLNSQGAWVNKTEGTDFTVNRTNGTVTFNTAPGVSPITGEDNVRITAYRTVSGYADRINKCQFGTLFGTNGENNRLFLSGNPDYPNRDFYSAPNDPTYFPDMNYSVLGDSSSAIVGYSLYSSYLATHKDGKSEDESIILRKSGYDSYGMEYFPVVGAIQGAGAISQNGFGYLATEPAFLTKDGVYAITQQDITGERLMQNRSFFLDGKLLKESHLENAISVVYDNNFILCVNGQFYILDGLQPVMTDKAMPYATRQYAAFYRTNVPATCLWVKDGELWFGTADGKVYRFNTDKELSTSYNDDGEPIVAIWETPDIDGKLFYKNKTLRYLAVRVGTAVHTSLSIYAMERGLWNFIKTDETFARYFKFSDLTFSKMTFGCDMTQKISRTKMRIKKVDKFRIKLVNDSLNEPLSLYDIAMEYVENGNFKG